MTERTLELITRNTALIGDGEELGVIHFVTAGEVPMYAGAAAATARTTPTFCVHSFPLPFASFRNLMVKGGHVVTPAIRHIPPQVLDSKIKNRSRLHWHIAIAQAQQVDPDAVTLLLDLEGNITECGGANFVLVKGNTIFSPTPRNRLLGISLKTVEELAPRIGMKYVETDLQTYDVINADEAWQTSTPFCVSPVTKINGVPIGDGTPGPCCRRMLEAWSELVGVDVYEQIVTTDE